MRKKPLIISLLLISLLVGGFFLYKYLNNPQTTIYRESTERGREYVQTQKNEQNSDWAYVDFEGQNKNKGNQVLGKQTLSVNHCYQMDIAFPIKFIREDKGLCQRYVSLREPKGGRIVIYQSEKKPSRLDDVSGINFRRLKGEEYDEYEEKLLVINGHDFLTFKKTEGSYEWTAFVVDRDRLFIINLLTFSTKNFDQEYKEMLKSIKFFD